MASSYPGALDTLNTSKTNSTGMFSDHANHHNDLADAVNKIEAELGITPSDSYATVKARLDAIAAALSTGVMTGSAPSWSVTNEATTRTLDASVYTMDGLADVLGTLIEDLKVRGVLA